MGDQPRQPSPAGTFSPDGLWWWDGGQWRSAISPDRRWRWDGRAWLPFAQPAARGGGGATAAVVITLLAFGGVVVLVGIVVVVALLTMGNQMANVFSNVAAALTSTPSP